MRALHPLTLAVVRIKDDIVIEIDLFPPAADTIAADTSASDTNAPRVDHDPQ